MYYGAKLMTIPTVGQQCYGGVLGYILKSTDIGYESGRIKGLIVGPDITGAKWSNITNTFVGGLSNLFGYGMSNSLKIIEQAGHTDSAALRCINYRGGGFSDWYLGSNNEFTALMQNKNLIGGWVGTTSDYYTSTEVNLYPNFAWVITIMPPYSLNYGAKDSVYRIRPIRLTTL